MERYIRKRRLDPVFNVQPTSDDGRTAQRVMNTNLSLVHDRANKGPCWTGYHKVKGMADYADDSCVKNGETKKKKKRKKRPSKKKEGAESSTDASSDDEKKKDSK